nr:acyltransferase family protein [Acinetobacter sp. Marseille-Q1620]
MRNHYLDTSKAILIFLVVFGHFIEQMIGWGQITSHTVLGVIYFVHMPAFIFISGLLFKDKNWIKNIIFFLSLYLPFQFLYPAFDAIWTGQIRFNWFERPYWILWYMLGMMVWTALTHFLIRTPFPVLISVFLSLLVGLSPWNNYQYSIGRIFTFLPFFVVGCVYGKQIIQVIQQHRYATIAGMLILSIITVLVYSTQINRFWLYGSLSYSQLKVTDWDGILIRAAILCISALGIFALFGCAKRLENHFIKLGSNTLAVYLLHGFVVILITKYCHLHFNIFVNILICAMLSILTCLILQQQVFDRLLRKLSLWLIKPVEYFGHQKEH